MALSTANLNTAATRLRFGKELSYPVNILFPVACLSLAVVGLTFADAQSYPVVYTQRIDPTTGQPLSADVAKIKPIIQDEALGRGGIIPRARSACKTLLNKKYPFIPDSQHQPTLTNNPFLTHGVPASIVPLQCKIGVNLT
jgi:hypothetical protein